MRILRSLDEIIIWVLIAIVGVINLAVFTGVVRGEDATDVRRSIGPSAVGACEGDPDTAAGRAIIAECDDSDDLPGQFIPTQGRQHVEAGTRVPFCEDRGGEVSELCYASNPPSSGLHLGVAQGVELSDGNVLNIPPDPGIYDFEIPREAIPHLQEHAGVFVGYNCRSASCREVAELLAGVVDQQLDQGERVVLAPDTDLHEDTIGMASWTRVDTFPSSDYDEDRVLDFIEAHSCRFDPESFCESQPDPRQRAIRQIPPFGL